MQMRKGMGVNYLREKRLLARRITKRNLDPNLVGLGVVRSTAKAETEAEAEAEARCR